MTQQTAPAPITRREAEALIVDFQLSELSRTGCRITCELYGDRGGGNCPGLNRLDDNRLHEIYHDYISGVERLEKRALLNAIIDFERAQIDEAHRTTCEVMAEVGRICDGFNQFTDEELPRQFPEALEGRVIVAARR